MAKYGLSTFLYAPLDEAAGTYGAVKQIVGAISYKEAFEKGDQEVYGDDILMIHDSGVSGGSLTLEVLDDDPVIFAELLGQKKREVTVKGEQTPREVYVNNSEDEPAPVGFGFIEREMSQGKKKGFTVKFYPKLEFSPYDAEGSTKKKTKEYKTTSVTSRIEMLENQDYRYRQRLDSMLDAVKVLYALFGAEVPAEVLAKLTQGGTPAPAPSNPAT